MLRNIVHHNVQAQNFCDVHPLKATNGTLWREEVIDQISISLGNSRQHFLSATFIDPALRLGYMGFIKKADDLRFYLAPVKVCDWKLEDVLHRSVQLSARKYGTLSKITCIKVILFSRQRCDFL